MTAKITLIRPMLAVTDLLRTIAFYGELGFRCTNTFGPPGAPAWCTLARDGWELMFNAPPRECVIRDVSNLLGGNVSILLNDGVTAGEIIAS